MFILLLFTLSMQEHLYLIDLIAIICKSRSKSLRPTYTATLSMQEHLCLIDLIAIIYKSRSKSLKPTCTATLSMTELLHK